MRVRHRAPAAWIVVALMVAWPAAGRAQVTPPHGGLSVDELVSYAIANNPDLAAARADVEAALGRLRQAGLRLAARTCSRARRRRTCRHW